MQVMQIRYFLLGVVAVVLASSFYLEYALGWEMCPLCLLQRWSWMALGAILCISHGQSSRRYVWIMLGIGMAFTLRHVWLQYLVSDDVMATCMPPSVESTHWWQTWLQTSDDCRLRSYTLLGLSLSLWSLFGQITLLFGLFYERMSAKR